MDLPGICQPAVRQNAGYLSLESGQDSCHQPVKLIVTKQWVFVEILPTKIANHASAFLNRLIKAAPFRITTILTDNGKEFSDRF